MLSEASTYLTLWIATTQRLSKEFSFAISTLVSRVTKRLFVIWGVLFPAFTLHKKVRALKVDKTGVRDVIKVMKYVITFTLKFFSFPFH